MQKVLGVLVVIAVIAGLVFFFRSGKKPGEEKEAAREGEGVPIEEVVSGLSRELGVTVPEDVERTVLADVTGGSARGLATRKYENGQFFHTILAALPDPAAGTFYAGWLVRGERGAANFRELATGTLQSSKGGYLLELSSSEDLRDHAKVVVTAQRSAREQMGSAILEGSF